VELPPKIGISRGGLGCWMRVIPMPNLVHREFLRKVECLAKLNLRCALRSIRFALYDANGYTGISADFLAVGFSMIGWLTAVRSSAQPK
jgi:hypothetical protein